MAQARLDEDAVARPHAVRIEGGEEERADHAIDYTDCMRAGRSNLPGCRLVSAKFCGQSTKSCHAFSVYLPVFLRSHALQDPNAGRYFRKKFACSDTYVVFGLQVDPETRLHAEVLPQTRSGIGLTGRRPCTSSLIRLGDTSMSAAS